MYVFLGGTVNLSVMFWGGVCVKPKIRSLYLPLLPFGMLRHSSVAQGLLLRWDERQFVVIFRSVWRDDLCQFCSADCLSFYFFLFLSVFVLGRGKPIEKRGFLCRVTVIFCLLKGFSFVHHTFLFVVQFFCLLVAFFCIFYYFLSICLT